MLDFGFNEIRLKVSGRAVTTETSGDRSAIRIFPYIANHRIGDNLIPHNRQVRDRAVSQWKIARLELAGTPEFPEGSPCRSYLLRLPLREEGTIDEQARSADPKRATVRRFWPKEPDLSGYILGKGSRWVFSYGDGYDDHENLFHLENHPITQNGYVTLTEPSGERLPFRVVSLALDWYA